MLFTLYIYTFFSFFCEYLKWCLTNPWFSGDPGSGASSPSASVEGGCERRSSTSDNETTDIRRINHQPNNRDGRHDPNR